MAIRYLLIAIDDARPLGPQLKAARAFGKVSWKLLRELAGGRSVRNLQYLADAAHFCERQVVRRGINLLPHELACGPVGNDQPG